MNQINQICEQAQDFLNAVFRSANFDITVKASGDGDCLLNLDGDDAPLLRNENGELLEAFEQIVNKVFSNDLSGDERIVCDVQNFRATREAELRAMAHYAADRVRATGSAFTFNPMNANERRLIHLTLVNETDLMTESAGEGNLRRVKVLPKLVS